MAFAYTRDVSDIVSSLPDTDRRAGPDDPSGYLPGQGLVDAVNVALMLGKPLLLTGDPGTGKTQLANSLAWQLASRKALNVRSSIVDKFETKSSSLSRDLFYIFDAIRRFQAAREADGKGAPIDNGAFITYNALGLALLRALPAKERPSSIPFDLVKDAPARSVVLIDEIDKAPRDFPNDLLNEIEQMYFRIPELENLKVGGRGVLSDDMRPIVVITSNSERNLPDPFLRRCVFYNIPFPEKTELRDILVKRIGQFSSARGKLLDDALAFFYRLQKAANRTISPAELIDWLVYMLKAGAAPASRLADAREAAFAGLSALVKEPKDQTIIHDDLKAFLAGQGA